MCVDVRVDDFEDGIKTSVLPLAKVSDAMSKGCHLQPDTESLGPKRA